VKKSVAVLVSDMPGSGLDARARALFSRLECFDTTFVCHRGRTLDRITKFMKALGDTKPGLIYLMDPIYAGVAAAWLYRSYHRVPVIVDTGDLVFELAREMGRLGPAQLGIVRWAEQTALKMASSIIVRGSFHRDWLVKAGFPSVYFVPDGVDLKQFFPMDVALLREQLGISRDHVVIGIVGTINWNERRKFCYGWDLVEAFAHLSDTPVKALIVGDGDGVKILKSRAREISTEDDLVFAGRVAYADLPRYINAMDVCVLTQPDSPMSHVRTTGKLPLYLACDRYVISTQVGTAARVLPPDSLLPYNGIGRDPDHPARLAAKIRALALHRDALQLHGRGVSIAREHFNYDKLARDLAKIVDRLLAN
jgi:glycosyltransferase involved in cell wall biosynthesis